jgi:protease II
MKPTIQPIETYKIVHGDKLHDNFSFIRTGIKNETILDSNVNQFVKEIKLHYDKYNAITFNIQKKLRMQIEELDETFNYQPPMLLSIELYNEDYLYFTFQEPHLVIVRMKIPEQYRSDVTELLDEFELFQKKMNCSLASLVIDEYLKKSDIFSRNFCELQIVYDKNLIIDKLKRKWIEAGQSFRVAMPPDTLSLSTCQRYVAYHYSFNKQHILEIQDIQTKQIIDTIISDKTIEASEFSKDSKTIYFTLSNANHRPYKVISHHIQSDSFDKTLIEESDESFFLEFYRTKDNECLFINSGNRSISETYLINESDNTVVTIKSREEQGLFFPEHNGKYFYAVTNADQSPNLKVVRFLKEDLTKRENWITILSAQSNIKIDDMDMFEVWVCILSQYINHIICSLILFSMKRRMV